MQKIIDESIIQKLLIENEREDKSLISEILEKAKLAKGLEINDVATLLNIKNPDLINELYNAAKYVKETIYGNRLVLFAPLYISNICANSCLYCAFRKENTTLTRRQLSLEEIKKETETIISEGHKRILLVAGESTNTGYMKYITDAIETIYKTTINNGAIRRINVNVAPLSIDDFKILNQAKIGTYQLFQETYHLKTYNEVHVSGKKKDYFWRLEVMDRAMQAGIEDVGIGVLFGLADWKTELLALMQHAKHLEKNFGVGPHTISIPRIEPALGSDLSIHIPNPVSDDDFFKIVAILRLAVPYTGIILSTRESPNIRRKALALGVSQLSAGSKTNPGGYAENIQDAEQFSIGDNRTLDEVIYDICSLGYIPSFCTGCYRLGRTGEHFMELAMPGNIKNMCEPNAIVTFKEYLNDYASQKTKELGEKIIKDYLSNTTITNKNLVKKLIDKVESGKRDIFI